MPTVYYVIPNCFPRDFRLKSFFKALFKGNFTQIKKNWFPKHKAIGGVKVGYQHCLLLKSLNIPAFPLLMSQYHGNFYGYDVATKQFDDIIDNIQDDDIVVIPDLLPILINKFKKGKKVLFLQNWEFIYESLDAGIFKPLDCSYHDMGFEMTLSCTTYLDSLANREPPNQRAIISNFIDHSKFKPDPSARIKGRILAMTRKNPADLAAIVNKLGHYASDVIYADGLTEDELIKEYQKADIFLATGYPEGFGLPPLEAMACGCAVVGFTGKGALEFMHHEKTALVAEDGDVNTAATLLLRVIEDESIKEELRSNGEAISKKYTRENSLKELIAFYKRLNIIKN